MTSKIAKLVQLFETGKVVTHQLASGGQLIVWVQKLSPFYYEECVHQGRIARSLKMMAIREVGTDEYALFQSQVEASAKSALVVAMVQVKGDETLGNVLRELRTDPEWRERIEIVEHSPEQLEALGVESVEWQQAAKMLEEYQAEIVKRVKDSEMAYRRELNDCSEQVLRERFLDHYVESAGMVAFGITRARYELFYAARECHGVKGEDEKWDHSKCDHTQFMLDEPNDVNQLDADLQTEIHAALAEITVPPDLARFMAGPESSSDSPGPTSPPEGSAASSQETSAVPATTS